MQFEPLAPIPAVVLASKLRHIPLFRFVSVDELFRIATIAEQVRYESGSRVQALGDHALFIQVLLEGRFVTQSAPGASPVRLDPPAMVGFREVMEGITVQSSVTAETDSIALVMRADDFRTLLSANIELAQGLFRILLEQDHGEPGPSKIPAGSPEERDLSLDGAKLKTVDKALYWQTVSVFERTSADELFAIAGISREIDVAPEALLFTEGHPSSIWLLLAGEIALEGTNGANGSSAAAGDCVGIRETLAGSDWAWRARARTPVKALEIDRDALFELLGDRIDVLQSLFGSVFQVKGEAVHG